MEKRGILTLGVAQNGTEFVRLSTEGKLAISFFSSLLLPFVESYWVTLSFIKLLPVAEVHTAEILEQRVQSLAETMFNEGFIIFYESCNRESIGNAMQKFVQLKLINQKEISS